MGVGSGTEAQMIWLEALEQELELLLLVAAVTRCSGECGEE